MALFDSSRTPLILRLALRDFRGGLSGFGVFLGCIALGVAAIAGVGSVSRSLSDGLARQGGVILGGDVSFDLIQRQANPAERAYLAQAGRLSEVAVLRAIARRDGGETALVEVKAVDAAYPSAGAAVLDPAMPVAEALADRGGVYGIAADSALLARLDMKVGDRPCSSPSRTSSRPASASARACSCPSPRSTPPASCSPARWCAGSIA
jgi:putative ABC transport system permease protein